MSDEEGPQRTEILAGLVCPRCHAYLSVGAGAGDPAYACVQGHCFSPAEIRAEADETFIAAMRMARAAWTEKRANLRGMAAKERDEGRPEAAAMLGRAAEIVEHRLVVLEETLREKGSEPR